MPLANSTAWPPPAFAEVFDEIQADDAWYSGRNGRIQAKQNPLTGTLRLWINGKPAVNNPTNLIHAPLPGDIAATSADLLFADTPKITIAGEPTQKRLDYIIENGGIAETLVSGAEVAAALSGVFLRATWDRSLADHAILSVVHPDCALPEFRYGRLSAVTFWRELSTDTSSVWRHLERHEPGRITHSLHRGSTETLGASVPLDAHPETKGLTGSLSGGVVATGITDLTAVYVPNILPNRRHRGSPLGRSDYQGVHDMFQALDDTWTSWMRDIRLARARLIVPRTYLKDEGRGQGASFADEEIYEALKIRPEDSGDGINLVQFAIRVEEHRATAEAIVRQATQSAGYSPQSFGLDGPSAVTATEIVARDHRSMVTREKKTRYWQRAVADILAVMLKLDVQHFGAKNIQPGRPTVEFGDGVANDPRLVAETVDMLARAQAVSTETRVRLVHPDWSDAEVKAETTRIMREAGTEAPDPVASFSS